MRILLAIVMILVGVAAIALGLEEIARNYYFSHLEKAVYSWTNICNIIETNMLLVVAGLCMTASALIILGLLNLKGCLIWAMYAAIVGVVAEFNDHVMTTALLINLGVCMSGVALCIVLVRRLWKRLSSGKTVC